MRALLAVAMVALLVVAGCGGGEETNPQESATRQAPEVEGVTLDGEPLSLAGFRGRPVFVNVWSSW